MRTFRTRIDNKPGYIVTLDARDDKAWDKLALVMENGPSSLPDFIEETLPSVDPNLCDMPKELPTGDIWVELSEDDGVGVNVEILERILPQAYLNPLEMQQCWMSMDTVTVKHYEKHGPMWVLKGENLMGRNCAEWISTCLSAKID